MFLGSYLVWSYIATWRVGNQLVFPRWWDLCYVFPLVLFKEGVYYVPLWPYHISALLICVLATWKLYNISRVF